MTKKIPAWLKVYGGSGELTSPADLSEVPAFPALCNSFQAATGWQMEAASADPEMWRDAGGGLKLIHPDSSPQRDAGSLPREAAENLAAAIGTLLVDLQDTRQALWMREAELAAGVPVRRRPDEEEHLAQRLQSVLKSGAGAVGAQAAALYLLDDSTRSLKLRSGWGLPKRRLMDPPRPLRGAAADLEALVGHAVVLENAQLLSHWRIPEEFASAACVPVSTPTTPLGTMWVFCRKPREFSPAQTELLEIVSGRLAAELEREILLGECLGEKQWRRQASLLSQSLRDRVPRLSPLADEWDLAGWSSAAEEVGGDFCDWTLLPDGTLGLSLGSGEGAPLLAATTAESLRAAIMARGMLPHDAAGMIDAVGEVLFRGASGDRLASLWYARLEPKTGGLQCASAGGPTAVVVGRDKGVVLTRRRKQLGLPPARSRTNRHHRLASGDMLVAATRGGLKGLSAARGAAPERELIKVAGGCLGESAERAVGLLREQMAGTGPPRDQAILVVRRK